MTKSPIRRATFLFVAILVSSVGSASSDSLGREPTAGDWSTGFATFVGSLDEDQRDDALYDFDDDERFDLRLAPLGLEGLEIEDMSDAQWRELEGLLGQVLSPSGLSKMNTIRSLEREVAETEGGLFGFLMDRIRRAKRYFLAVFGPPGPDRAWGLRFDGHHVSFNWTIVPGEPISVTPVFWGGQPRVVPNDLERAGLRVLPDEENRAMELVGALAQPERETARIEFSEGSGIRRPMSIAGGVPLSLEAPAGIRRSVLSPGNRKRLDAVIEVQLQNFAAPIADHYRSRIEGEADSIRFAYAVPDSAVESELEAGTSFYYRVQGRGFLIEYDNTSEAADHIHVVWRDMTADFGRDLLGEHLAASHSVESGR